MLRLSSPASQHFKRARSVAGPDRSAEGNEHIRWQDNERNALQLEHESQRGAALAAGHTRPMLPPKPKLREAKDGAAASELQEARSRHAELAERLGHVTSLLHQQQSVTGEEERKLRVRRNSCANCVVLSA